MILYHFTHQRNLQSILKHGLVPTDDLFVERALTPADGNASGACDTIGAGKVVWFKGTPSNFTPLARPRVPDACFQVRIASDDRKLKQYLPWLQKYLTTPAIRLDDPLIQEGALDCWIYFGVVTPRHLRVLYRGESHIC
jgi:hypothetical protein